MQKIDIIANDELLLNKLLSYFQLSKSWQIGFYDPDYPTNKQIIIYDLNDTNIQGIFDRTPIDNIIRKGSLLVSIGEIPYASELELISLFDFDDFLYELKNRTKK